MFKLVLIDDDAEVLAINQKYLTGAGFTVYTAISPREGVLSIRKNLPDCILLDVMLPEADGYRVCRYIRSFSSVRLPKIIISLFKASLSSCKACITCSKAFSHKVPITISSVFKSSI